MEIISNSDLLDAMMTAEYEDVAAAFSPASSVASSASAMSLSADASPVPSPADSTASTESSSTTVSECGGGGSGSCTIAQPQSEMSGAPAVAGHCGKRKQAWEGGGGTAALDNDKRRRVASSSAMPKPTHKAEYNEQLQGQASAHYGIQSERSLKRLRVPLTIPFRVKPSSSC